MLSKVFSKKKTMFVGLDISPISLNITLVENKKEEYWVKDFFSKKFDIEIINSGNFIDEDLMVETISEFIEKNSLKNESVNFSLSSNDSYVKKMTLPDLPDKELAVIVIQEIEKTMPFALEELYIDFNVVKRYVDTNDHTKKADIIYAAAQKSTVQNYLNIIKNAGLKINAVDISSFAILKAKTHMNLLESEGSCLSVFIDYENTDIAVIKNGMPVEINTIPTGRKDILECLKISTDSFSEDKNQAKDKMKSIYDNICYEISNLATVFQVQNANEPVLEKIILTSRGKIVKNLDKYISEKTNMQTILSENFFSVKIDENIDVQEINFADFMVSTGLALKGLEC